jgi:tetratricopeptide (TPR) repeat protein
MRLPAVFIAIVFGLLLATPARAQSLQQYLSQCSSGNIEHVLQGCTALINSSRLDRKNKAVAYLTRGNAYARQGELDSAIADFSKAIRRNSRSLPAYFNRGNAHFAQENFDQAIIDYSQAISLQPDHVLSYNGRGNAYLAKGETERAIAEYDKALEIDPNNNQAAQNRALAYAKDGDIGGVFRNFRAMVKVFFRSIFGGR